MSKFLLIVCKDENDNSAFGFEILKSLFAKLIHIFKPDRYLKWAEDVGIFEDMTMTVFKIPYKADKIQKIGKRKRNKIIKAIEVLKTEKNINSVHISDKLRDIEWLTDLCSNNSLGETLYRALVLKIIDEVYSNKGISIRDLDITIVHGMEDEHLFEVIRLLSSSVKFLTVVSNVQETIEDSLNDIYSETGLAIGVTKDFKRGLKNVDVIINLGSLKEFVVNSRINTKAIIINYGKLDLARIFSENTIITGVDVEFPQEAEKVLSAIQNHFSRLELAGIIIGSYKFEGREKPVKQNISENYLANLAGVFEELGFTIKKLHSS